MSKVDEQRAAQALAYRLNDWGVDNPHGKAIGFIADLVEQGWRMDPQRETRPHPPKSSEACRTCGRAMHHPDAVCDTPTTRPARPAGNTSEHVARLRRGLGEED